MQGRSDPNAELLDAAALCRHLVPDDSVHAFLADLAPGAPVRAAIVKPDGSTVAFLANHTMNDEQIGWFRAGGGPGRPGCPPPITPCPEGTRR